MLLSFLQTQCHFSDARYCISTQGNTYTSEVETIIIAAIASILNFQLDLGVKQIYLTKYCAHALKYGPPGWPFRDPFPVILLLVFIQAGALQGLPKSVRLLPLIF